MTMLRPRKREFHHARCILAAVFLACAVSPSAALGMASAELYGTEAHFYGRFEARIRHAPGDGVVSSFFLWKEGSSDANAYWNELDMEKVGANCEMHTNAYYGKPAAQHTQTNTMPSNICADYHTYTFEWTPTYISWSVDGKEFRRETGATATAFAQNATGGMTVHFNLWPGNASFGGDISKTTLPVHEYISWVQYSSYDNGAFGAPSRQEFDGSSVPAGWAVGNWSSPFNLSTHNPQNVSCVNGIAVMSLTNDNATGNPGTPPADSASDGTSGSGGSPSSGGTSGSGSGGASGGGATGSGGASSSGGASFSGSGGTAAVGGAVGAGGMTASGGATGTPVAGAGGMSGGQGGSNAAGGTHTSSSSSASGTGGNSTPTTASSTGGTSDTSGTGAKAGSSGGCSMTGTRQGAGSATCGFLLGILGIAAYRVTRRHALPLGGRVSPSWRRD
jgi:hypothetical protein